MYFFLKINIVEDIDMWKGKWCSLYVDLYMISFDGM